MGDSSRDGDQAPEHSLPVGGRTEGEGCASHDAFYGGELRARIARSFPMGSDEANRGSNSAVNGAVPCPGSGRPLRSRRKVDVGAFVITARGGLTAECRNPLDVREARCRMPDR